MPKFIFLIFFILITSNLKAEIIKNFIVEGNERISAETIKVYSGIELNKSYDQDSINNALKELYSTNFFEDIQISIEGDTFKIYVKEYPLINSVELEGEKSNTVKKSVLERLSLKSSGSFIESSLNEDVNLLKKIYASIGFNFAQVEAKIEKFSNNRINLIYVLDKGKKTDIKKINFIGDKKLKERRLRDIIVSEEAKFWKFLSKNTFLNSNTINLDKRLLENYYKSLGYYDVQILSNSAEVSNQNFTTLTYTINAGNRYKVNKISLNLSEVLNKELFTSLEKNYQSIVGKYYSPFKVKNLLDDLDELIVDNDLQFVEHNVNETISNENIEIAINIFEGKKELVERINILGNTVTEESVIRSEMLIDEGDPANNLKLEKSVAKLKSRNIFGDVRTKVSDGSSKDQKIIDIIVEEKPTGEISAGAGIGTNGGSFAFNISENNWLGKGININTSLDVSAETFTGGINVNNPNYNFSGNSINYFIENTKNDKPDSGFENNIISTGIGTSFEQYKDVFLSPSLSLSYDDLKVDSTASNSLKKQKGTFTDFSFNYGISYDNRDRVYQPTEGYLSSFSQSLPIIADASAIRNTYQLSLYNSFGQDFIGSFKFYTSAINGLSNEDVRLSKRTFLSTNRLRGFESGKVGPKDGLDYVGGNYAIATNFDLNLPNLLPESTKTDVGLFLDLGNVWGVDYDKTIDDSSKLRSSAGITTNWLSPVGPMSFIFSQNISKASTDVTESFNFRLGTTF
ncbi:MAG: outer membrane protein assembly factor BamA [Pelagibacteraceae bacterium]